LGPSDHSARDRLSASLALPPGRGCLRRLALLFAHSGDSLLWLFAAAVALALGGSAGLRFALRVLAATAAAGLPATILKWLFRRERPPGDGRGFYTRFDRPSFPSGHAARTSCLALALAPLLPVWSWPFVALWVVSVGLSRVALQVHFAADILAGWAVGIVVGIVLLVLF
jgi:membrane-associated phospholipid phosphatase